MLGPFLPAIVWAAMIVVSTWPLMLRIERWLWGRRKLAVAAMTIALLLVFIVPFSLALGTIVAHVDDILAGVKSLEELDTREPPAWVTNLPLVGARVDELWRSTIAQGGLGARITPYLGDIVRGFVAQVGSFGAVSLQFLLTVVVAALLYARGEDASRIVQRFAWRVGEERGEAAVRLAGQAIRSVAMGIVLTAIVQSLLGGLGLYVAGVPFAPVLTAVMFILGVAQIGVVPVMIGGTIWLFWKDHAGWGTAMIVWTVIVGTFDNVLRPLLIRRGVKIPLILIFAGVIGGMLAFGLIGLFIGPMVLAVTWTLFTAWVETGGRASPTSTTT